MQENAVVHTYKLIAKYDTIQVQKQLFGVFNTGTEEVSHRRLVKLESTINRPVILRDFYPGQGGAVNFIEKWQPW